MELRGLGFQFFIFLILNNDFLGLSHGVPQYPPSVSGQGSSSSSSNPPSPPTSFQPSPADLTPAQSSSAQQSSGAPSGPPAPSSSSGGSGSDHGQAPDALSAATSDDARSLNPYYGGGGGGGPPGGGFGGNNLGVKCSQSAPGRFSCIGVNPDLITLRAQHVLWLQGPQSGDQALQIEIPNYKIDELIKAGFKPGPGNSKTGINILLKKPETSYGAEVERTPSIGTDAEVNLQYEPVGPLQVVHFPNDKPYNPLSGPILPPPRDGGGGGGFGGGFGSGSGSGSGSGGGFGSGFGFGGGSGGGGPSQGSGGGTSYAGAGASAVSSGSTGGYYGSRLRKHALQKAAQGQVAPEASKQ